MRILLLTAIILVLSCTALHTYANDSTSLFSRITNFPSKFFNKVNNKTGSLDKQLDKQTEKYLRKLANREATLKKKLYRFDSTAAKNLFANNPEQQYALLAQKLKTDTATQGKSMSGEYLANVDSLQKVLFLFLNKNPQLLNSLKSFLRIYKIH